MTIENTGSETVTLRSRYWKITDARGRIQEVKGRGRGRRAADPQARPGSSNTPPARRSATPSGFMVGAYQMETAEGEHFNVSIPAFSLDSPHTPRRIN